MKYVQRPLKLRELRNCHVSCWICERDYEALLKETHEELPLSAVVRAELRALLRYARKLNLKRARKGHSRLARLYVCDQVIGFLEYMEELRQAQAAARPTPQTPNPNANTNKGNGHA